LNCRSGLLRGVGATRTKAISFLFQKSSPSLLFSTNVPSTNVPSNVPSTVVPSTKETPDEETADFLKKMRFAEKKGRVNKNTQLWSQMRDLWLSDLAETVPILADTAKDMIYELHVNDPERWSVEELADRFQLRRRRVSAIILLKQEEKNEIERTGKPLDRTAVEYFENFFGTTETGKLTRSIRAELGTSENLSYRKAEEGIDERRYTHKFIRGFEITNTLTRFRRDPPQTLPDARIIEKGTKTKEEAEDLKKKGFFPILIINTDRKGRKNYNREMTFVEVDGTIREASWKERLFVYAPKYLRKSTSQLHKEAMAPYYAKAKAAKEASKNSQVPLVDTTPESLTSSNN